MVVVMVPVMMPMGMVRALGPVRQYDPHQGEHRHHQDGPDHD